MGERTSDSDEQSDLRTQAEATLRFHRPSSPATSNAGTDKLVHELQTHQIELELQNEELRRTQLEVVEARDAYADLYDAAPLGLLSVNEQGLVVKANLTVAKLLGRASQSFFNSPASNFIVDDDQDVFYFFQRTLWDRLQGAACEVRMHRAGAEPFWARLDGAVVVTSSGDVTELRLAVTDITRRKRAEELAGKSFEELERRVDERTAELAERNHQLEQEIECRRAAQGEARQLQRQLEHVTRVSTMGEMATGLAHEINQPLAAITVYSDSCLKRAQSAPGDALGLAPALERIAEQALHAGTVIRRIRKLVKREVGQHESFHLDNVIDDVLSLLESELRDGNIALTTQTANIPAVYGDSVQISQVVLNLIRNAADAICTSHHDPRLIDLSVAEVNGGQLQVSVCDSGAGLSDGATDGIFEAFYTTKSNGLGMGLAISRTIMESHNGRIWATPNPTHGTTFHFTLPVTHVECVPASGDIVTSDPVIESTLDQKSTVFIVDDEPAVRTSLRYLLEGEQVSVAVYASATDYLEAWQPSMRGCLLLDSRLPGMSGIELLDKLSTEGFDLPVIMISGHGDRQAQEDATKRGVTEFLTKPFRSQDLLTRIRQVMPDSIRARGDGLELRKRLLVDYCSVAHCPLPTAHCPQDAGRRTQDGRGSP